MRKTREREPVNVYTSISRSNLYNYNSTLIV